MDDQALEQQNPIQALIRKRNMGQRVLVYCSSGTTRSPTVALAYLCLFKRSQNWNDVEKASEKIFKDNTIAYPNHNLVMQMTQEQK